MLDCWERDRNYPPEFSCQIHGDNSNHDSSDCIVLRKEFAIPNSSSTGADDWELKLILGDMDLGEGCTTRIGSSRALAQVQVGAGADHHRRRSELDRDLGGILAVTLGVEASRTTDSINQAEGAAEANAAAVAAAAIFHLLIRL